MPDFNPKRLLERLDKAADNLERTVTRKAKATYQNGKDIIRADRNIENDTPTLRPEDRLEERSELSRVISGLDREQRYMHASDKRVLAAEARARRKFTRESSAVVSSSAVAGGSVLLTAKTAGTTSKLAALKLSTAAKHTGKAANNFARFSVIESERIRRRLPAPEIDHGAEFKTGLRNGFVNRLQAEAMSKLGMGALHEVDHAIDGEALRARALDALASRVPSESYAGHHIAEARATPYAGPVRTPDYSFKQTTMSTTADGRTYMYTPTVQRALPSPQQTYTPAYTQSYTLMPTPTQSFYMPAPVTHTYTAVSPANGYWD